MRIAESILLLALFSSIAYATTANTNLTAILANTNGSLYINTANSSVQTSITYSNGTLQVSSTTHYSNSTQVGNSVITNMTTKTINFTRGTITIDSNITKWSPSSTGNLSKNTTWQL